MLNSGFEKVVAMDGEAVVEEVAKELNDERLTTIVSNFEDFDYTENTYDLINAQYSLPFMSREHFQEVMEKIKSSLKENGIFVGTFFGNNDSWNTKTSRTNFHSREDIKKLFDDFEIIEFLEKEENKPAVREEIKHWHTFHVTAKKI